jgi:hypothetical protein
MQLEGLGQLKNSMALSGIKPATFRFVAQCLNQLRHRVTPLHWLILLLRSLRMEGPFSVLIIERSKEVINF